MKQHIRLTWSNAPDTLSTAEAAYLLHSSETTVLRWIAEKGLPSHKPGQNHLIDKNELREWWDKQLTKNIA